jgi:hypothetical protein
MGRNHKGTLSLLYRAGAKSFETNDCLGRVLSLTSLADFAPRLRLTRPLKSGTNNAGLCYSPRISALTTRQGKIARCEYESLRESVLRLRASGLSESGRLWRNSFAD